MSTTVQADPAILPGIESTRWTICLIVKRLWTPSFVLYSGGWVVLALGVFYWFIDVIQSRRWTFPFVVVGMNSLMMYLLAALAAGWTRSAFSTHLGALAANWTFWPMLESLGVLLIFWLFCLWLYRKQLFVRI